MLKMSVLLAGGILFFLAFAFFTVPGLIYGCFFPRRFETLVSATYTLIAITGWQLIYGEWILFHLLSAETLASIGIGFLNSFLGFSLFVLGSRLPGWISTSYRSYMRSKLGAPKEPETGV